MASRRIRIKYSPLTHNKPYVARFAATTSTSYYFHVNARVKCKRKRTRSAGSELATFVEGSYISKKIVLNIHYWLMIFHLQHLCLLICKHKIELKIITAVILTLLTLAWHYSSKAS